MMIYVIILIKVINEHVNERASYVHFSDVIKTRASVLNAIAMQ